PAHDVLYATGLDQGTGRSALFTVDRSTGAAQLDFYIADDARFAYFTGATFDASTGLILASSYATTPDLYPHPGLYAIDPVQHTTPFLGSPAPVGLAFAPAPVPASPSPARSAEGIGLDDVVRLTGDQIVPPDPSGAAGRYAVVEVTNGAIEWISK